MNISTAIAHGIDLGSGQSHCCDARVTEDGRCIACEDHCRVIHVEPESGICVEEYDFLLASLRKRRWVRLGRS